MSAKFSVTYLDYDRESSTVTVNLEEKDILDPLLAAELQTAMGAVRTAINDVTIGLRASERRVYQETRYAAPGAAATSPQAQRETKWLVRGFDNVDFTAWSMEIPAADLTLLEANTDRMNPLSEQYGDLKSALETHALSSRGNPITVVEAVHVGRNT